jgi:hypothetical protein
MTTRIALALQGRVDLTSASAFCQGVYQGRLSGLPVVGGLPDAAG